MTLPSGGPLSFGDIQGEFGGGTPLSLSNYYSGGSNVIAGTQGADGTIPSGGQISFHNFYGSTRYLDAPNVTPQTFFYDFVGDPYNEYNQAQIGFRVGAIGTVNPTNSAIYGAPWDSIYYNKNNYIPGGGTTPSAMWLVVVGASNSGWTTMTINGTAFARADATFFAGGTWRWETETDPSVGGIVYFT